MVGMIIQTRSRAVHVSRSLDVPSRCLVEYAGVMIRPFITSGGTRTLMVWQKRLRIILLLDETRGGTCHTRRA
jgi:hypothetical protein